MSARIALRLGQQLPFAIGLPDAWPFLREDSSLERSDGLSSIRRKPLIVGIWPFALFNLSPRDEPLT
jgi:hypothetical protein